VRLGQEATTGLDAMPGREFKGRVRFIDPVVDPATRTARVRIELPNSKGELKPGMFAHAELQMNLGERLVVPRGALLDTGTRQVVYVKTGDGSFAGREVRVGEQAGDLVEVVEGLAEGEEVVAAASFLVDSQSQLQTGASVQWGGASERKSE
jgi:Cu(I)/Ag(I) efflux system membrane fusion protein